jgi:uncharacterized protein
MTKKEDDFYDKLKISLNETTVFPADYMYKFIIPNKEELKKQVSDIFNFEGAVINSTLSKTGKYVSITVLTRVDNADVVIEKYREAAVIERIISL